MTKIKGICNRELLDSGYKMMRITYDPILQDEDEVEATINGFIEYYGNRNSICLRRTNIVGAGNVQVMVECWKTSFGVMVWMEGMIKIERYGIDFDSGVEHQYIEMGRRSN